MIRGQLAEFGIVLTKGIQHALWLVGRLLEGAVPDIPPLAVKVIVTLAEQLRDLQVRIGGLDKDLKTWSRIRFTSAILPPYLRRAKSIEELLPWL